MASPLLIDLLRSESSLDGDGAKACLHHLQDSWGIGVGFVRVG